LLRYFRTHGTTHHAFYARYADALHGSTHSYSLCCATPGFALRTPALQFSWFKHRTHARRLVARTPVRAAALHTAPHATRFGSPHQVLADYCRFRRFIRTRCPIGLVHARIVCVVCRTRTRTARAPVGFTVTHVYATGLRALPTHLPVYTHGYAVTVFTFTHALVGYIWFDCAVHTCVRLKRLHTLDFARWDTHARYRICTVVISPHAVTILPLRTHTRITVTVHARLLHFGLRTHAHCTHLRWFGWTRLLRSLVPHTVYTPEPLPHTLRLPVVVRYGSVVPFCGG